MLECAMPKCCDRGKFLRSGTLHRIGVMRDDGSLAKKMIWLCDSCSRWYVLQTWRLTGEQIYRWAQSKFDLADIVPVAAEAPHLLPQPA